MASCTTCHASIEFVPTAKSGAFIPINAEPDATGNIILKDGQAHVLSTEQAAALPPGALRWQSHFATCSNPKAHRG